MKEGYFFSCSLDDKKMTLRGILQSKKKKKTKFNNLFHIMDNS